MSKITQAAKGQNCIKCGKNDGTICSRHYNGTYQHMLGKGRGIKCSDLASADLCQECDAGLSEGVLGDYETWDERDARFLLYVLLTNIRREKDGVIKT